MGTRVVPDWGSAKVDTFWKFVKNLICFHIFHQQDAPKRVSRYQKWILRKILRFPMPRHVSKLHLGFENHRFPSKSRPQPRIWAILGSLPQQLHREICPNFTILWRFCGPNLSEMKNLIKNLVSTFCKHPQEATNPEYEPLTPSGARE